MSFEVASDPYKIDLPNGWRQVDRFIIRATEVLAACIGAAFTTMIFVEIVSRYFFDFSNFWVNSVAEFLLVWFFLIGAGLALRHNAHVGFEFVLDMMPKRLAHIIYIFSRLAILLFCGVMAWSGYLTLGPASRQIEGATQISFLWVMLSLPIGFALLVYHQVALLVGSRRGSLSEGLKR